MSMVSRVLVVGLPRSGTTWVATMLARTEGAVLVLEPDNQFTAPYALRAKRGLPGGFYTAPARDARTSQYERLWLEAFGARGSGWSRTERLRRALAQRSFARAGEAAVRASFAGRGVPWLLRAAELLAVPERPVAAAAAEAIVVKSVYAPLAAEWIASRVDAQVVVVERDLRNVLSSWVALGWADADEPAAGDPALQEALRARHDLPPRPEGGALARLAWFLALLELELEDTVRAHPEWHVVRHEDVASHPAARFPELAARLGLRWGHAAAAALAASDRPGSGYAIEREAASLPDVWRSRLTAAQAAEIAAVLAAFPLA
jgi:hypothetical protein